VAQFQCWPALPYQEELVNLYERLASDLAPWLRSAGKLRIILFITALVGTAVLFLFNPPCSKEPLIIPFSFLITLEFAGRVFTGIVLVECLRIIAHRATSSWTQKKHFAVVFAVIALLAVFRVFVIFPKTSISYYSYGWSLAEKKEYHRALEGLDISIRYNPENTKAYLERSYVQTELGNLDAALNDSNKAIDIDPNNGKAYRERGYTYYELGDHKKAFDDWNKAITLDPSLASTLDKWIKKVKPDP
jgi:tetratricopeptide (TPR) repeat protein